MTVLWFTPYNFSGCPNLATLSIEKLAAKLSSGQKEQLIKSIGAELVKRNWEMLGIAQSGATGAPPNGLVEKAIKRAQWRCRMIFGLIVVAVIIILLLRAGGSLSD